MKFIAHRINTAAELAGVPPEYGVELDLRDSGDKLILNHDPFGSGEEFSSYLKGYGHALLILNIKSERIEWRALDLLRERGIRDYFFLDSSFPMIHQLAEKGENNLALRYSEFEGLDTVLAMKGRAKWVWVDCFTRLPLDRKSHAALKDAGFKLCLVSPELQGRPGDIEPYREQRRREGLVFDAICAKLQNIPRWTR